MFDKIVLLLGYQILIKVSALVSNERPRCGRLFYDISNEESYCDIHGLQLEE